MKKDCLKVFSLLGLIMSVSSLTLAAPHLNDSIIAVVNSDVITLKDLKDYMSGMYRQLKIEQRSPKEIQELMASYEEKGVNQLVDDKLILAAANEKGIEIRQELVDKKLKEITDRYSSEDDFLKEISSQGITVTDLKNKMIGQLKAKYGVDLEVRNKVFVNPEDVTRYFNDHKEQFESKTKYSLDSVYISFDKGRPEALRRIQEARGKLALGATFESVSKEYSQAPSVGTLEQGQMVPAIEKEVFSLKQGELSQVIEVADGVYLFKVNGITSGAKQSLAEVREDIYNKIYQQQFQDKFKAWVDKLRSKAYVEIRN